MKQFYLLVFICLSCLEVSFAKTVYSIYCGDTKSADIKVTCRKDINLVQPKIKEVVESTELSYKDYTLIGKDFTIKKLKKTLKSITPKSGDVIMFYFSGHGIKDNLKFNKKYLDIDSLEKWIEDKGAGLNIITLDRCDKALIRSKSKTRGASKYAPPSKKVDTKIANTHQLFQGVTGTFIFYSSQENAYSYAKKNGNSFFTEAWIEQLDIMLCGNPINISWSTLLNLTRKAVVRELGGYNPSTMVLIKKSGPKGKDNTIPRSTSRPRN